MMRRSTRITGSGMLARSASATPRDGVGRRASRAHAPAAVPAGDDDGAEGDGKNGAAEKPAVQQIARRGHGDHDGARQQRAPEGRVPGAVARRIRGRARSSPLSESSSDEISKSSTRMTLRLTLIRLRIS